MHKDSVKIVLVFAMLCLIWGSTWLVIRLGLQSLTPMYSAGFRFLLASILIYVIMRVQGLNIQRDRESIKLYILQGLFVFILSFSLVYWSEQYIPSGLAAVLFAVFPFGVALFSYFMIPGEKIGIYKLSGIVLGFTGIVIIFSDDISGDFSSYLLGMIAMVTAGTVQAFMAVLVKKRGHHLNPLTMNLIPMFMAGVFLLSAAPLFENASMLKFDLNAVLSVLYLALFGSVITFTGYYWLLKRLNVVIVSLMAFITPVVAVFLGWVVMNESLSLSDLAGTFFVLTGLLTANAGSKIKTAISGKLKKQE